MGKMQRGGFKRAANAAMGIGAMGAMGVLGGTIAATKFFERTRVGLLKNIYPNSVYPTAGGRWGMDAGPANNAGLMGMRFDFRRK